MPEPLRTTLRLDRRAAPADVARALVRTLQPAEADIHPPTWLRDEQRPLVRRLVASLLRHGGALLAAPVGSGKTWMALAAMREVAPGAPVTVLAPAALRRHWRETARAVGMEVCVVSHTAASLGRLPAHGGWVVIDESHHLRHPATRRHGHVARWLVGGRALLLSATPVVNRLADLAAQLLLVVRDDALAPAGIPSLRELLAHERTHPALGELVVAEPRPVDALVRRASVSAPDASGALLARLDQLVLSPHPPLRALLCRVFWRAAASSPAALAETASRYARLLRHAADAAASGRRVGRDAIRRFAGAALEQLVLWELLPATDEAPLSLDDLPAVAALADEARRAARAPDGRCETLRRLLADGTPTVVFVGRCATLTWLRDRLADPRVAWCSGATAGIGPNRSDRRSVLDWFRADAAAAPLAPRHLLTTDVAAEGLDLGRAGRVVHYDLPWTEARLAQREGRLRRGAPRVRDVVTIRPAAALARRLRLDDTIARKGALPRQLDLAPGAEAQWLWRRSLAFMLGGNESHAAIAAMAGDTDGILVGFRILAAEGGGLATVLWLDADGVHESPATVRAVLERALVEGAVPLGAAEQRAVLSRVAPVLAARLRASQAASWHAQAGREGVQRLLARLWGMARDAARQRRPARLAQLERARAFVAGGHTVGEAALVRTLADADDRTLGGALDRLPAPSPTSVPVLRVTGLLVVRRRLAPASGAATFGAHDDLPHRALRPRRHADRLDPADPRQLPPHPGHARHRAAKR